MMKNHKFFIFFSVIMMVMLSLISALSYHTLEQQNQRLQINTRNAVALAKLLNDTRATQVAFQRQVQEWKDILIRGHDPQLYQIHYQAFSFQEKNMNDLLYSLQQQLIDLNMDTLPVTQLMEAHDTLGGQYREALQQKWDVKDPLSGQSVDLQVRGIDRPTSKALSHLALTIEKDAGLVLNTEAVQAQTNASNTFTILLTLSLGTLIFILASLAFIFFRSPKNS